MGYAIELLFDKTMTDAVIEIWRQFNCYGYGIDLDFSNDEINGMINGEKAPAPADMSMLDTLSEGKENDSSLDRERASEASGKMLTSVFSFIKEALPETSSKEGKENPLARALQDSFKNISNIEPDGKVKMQLTLESQEALNTLSSAIAMLPEISGKR